MAAASGAGAAGSLVGLALAALPGSARRLRDGQWTAVWLLTIGLLVALGLQFVVVRDHLAGGDYERMNTVFKFGEQIWRCGRSAERRLWL